MQMQASIGRTVSTSRALRPVLVALVLVLLLAGAFYVGSQLLKPSLPPAFGVAANGLIAVEVDGAIVTVNPDGTNMRRLELPFEGISSVSFSRDGTRFAAWATPEDSRTGHRSIIVADVDGSDAFEAVPDRYTLGPVSQFAWSPDNTVLAFSDGQDRLYLVDIAARTAREVAPDSSIRERRDPSWAPDGRLAYRCQGPDLVLHLCVASADMASERILQTSVGTGWAFQHSSWSPDGTRIAYYVDDAVDNPPELGYDVAVIDVATGQERILTVGHPEHTILPTWSPDGRYVVTIGTIIAADGSSVRLMNEPDGCEWSEPSPDGRWATCLNKGELQLYPIDGGPPTVLSLAAETGNLSWQRLALAN